MWDGWNRVHLAPALMLGIGLGKQFEGWKDRFWKGMVCAFLLQDEEAIAAVEKALELGLPPILLAPSRWFEQARPEFYERYVAPLLARYDL